MRIIIYNGCVKNLHNYLDEEKYHEQFPIKVFKHLCYIGQILLGVSHARTTLKRRERLH